MLVIVLAVVVAVNLLAMEIYKRKKTVITFTLPPEIEKEYKKLGSIGE